MFFNSFKIMLSAINVYTFQLVKKKIAAVNRIGGTRATMDALERRKVDLRFSNLPAHSPVTVLSD